MILTSAFASALPNPILACDFDSSLACAAGETPVQSEKTSFVTGLKGGAVKVGTDGVLAYPYQNNFDVQRGTISLWFKPDSGVLSSDSNLLFQHQSKSNNANLRFRILPESQNGACRDCYETALFTGAGDAVASISLAKNIPSLNGWHYLATSWDSQAIRIYLNGNLVDEYQGNLPIGAPSDVVFVGAYPPNGVNAHGAIDNLRIYNQVLTPADILAEFHSRSEHLPAPVTAGPITPEPQVIRTPPAQITPEQRESPFRQFLTSLIIIVVLALIATPFYLAWMWSQKIEAKERQRRREVVQKADPFIEKYVKGLKEREWMMVLSYKENEEVHEFLNHKRDVSGLISAFIGQRDYAEEYFKKGNDFKTASSLIEQFKFFIRFTDDQQKLRKILENKGVGLTAIELLDAIAEKADAQLKKFYDKNLAKIFNIIQRKLVKSKDPRVVLKEILRMTPGLRNAHLFHYALKKFDISVSDNELEKYLDEVDETISLEKFEENLGRGEYKLLGDFTELSGREFEAYLKDVFEHLNYTVVRTKKTGDQGADLILKSDEGETVVVQAKQWSGAVGNSAIQEAFAAKTHYKASKSMIVTNSTFTRSAKELALSTGVELWDGQKLTEVVQDINSQAANPTSKTYHMKINVNASEVSAPCIYCQEDVIVKIEDFPERGTEKEVPCSVCDFGKIRLRLDDKYYQCPGCKESFRFIKERVAHTKKCQDVKERTVLCTKCRANLTLDDAEDKELKKAGSIKINCPSCQHEITVKR